MPGVLDLESHAGPAFARHRTVIRPPLGVYLMALSTRLSSTWRERASASAHDGQVGGAVRPAASPPASASSPRPAVRCRSRQSAMASSSGTAPDSSPESPDSIRARLSRSLISSSSRSACSRDSVEEHRPRAAGSSAAPSMQRLDAGLDDRPAASSARGTRWRRSPAAVRSSRRRSVVSWTTTTAPGRPGPGKPGDVDGQALGGRPLPVQLLAVRAGPGQALVHGLLERPLAGAPPTAAGRPPPPARTPAARPARSLANSTRWSSSMATTPSTMPDRMVRSCSRSCSSWANVSASRPLMALNVRARSACSRPPSTRILCPRSPSASRRAPVASGPPAAGRTPGPGRRPGRPRGRRSGRPPGPRRGPARRTAARTAGR